MTTYTITLLSPVIGDGTPVINPYQPKLSDDYPGLGYTDVTGRDTPEQPGDPSVVMLEVITDDPAPLYADPDVLILEEVENEETEEETTL